MGVNGCIVDRREGETSAFVWLGNLVRPSGATGAHSAAALEDGPCHRRGRLANQYVPWLLNPLMSGLSLTLQALLVAVGIVILLTWVIMPVLVRILNRLLYPL